MYRFGEPIGWQFVANASFHRILVNEVAEAKIVEKTCHLLVIATAISLPNYDLW